MRSYGTGCPDKNQEWDRSNAYLSKILPRRNLWFMCNEHQWREYSSMSLVMHWNENNRLLDSTHCCVRRKCRCKHFRKCQLLETIYISLCAFGHNISTCIIASRPALIVPQYCYQWVDVGLFISFPTWSAIRNRCNILWRSLYDTYWKIFRSFSSIYSKIDDNTSKVSKIYPLPHMYVVKDLVPVSMLWWNC